MKYLLPIALALAVAACGSDEEVGAVPYKAPSGRDRFMMGGPDRAAIEAARAGDCSQVQVLRCFAYLGRGNEMAQSALGSCLTQNARPGDANWQEGVTWLRRAGDTGLPEAQGDLVQTLSQSSNTSDIVEAQTWRILYERGKSSPFPPTPLSRDITSKLDARLTPELRTEAETKASAWSYRFWTLDSNNIAEAKAAIAECPKQRRGPMRGGMGGGPPRGG